MKPKVFNICLVINVWHSEVEDKILSNPKSHNSFFQVCYWSVLLNEEFVVSYEKIKNLFSSIITFCASSSQNILYDSHAALFDNFCHARFRVLMNSSSPPASGCVNRLSFVVVFLDLIF